MVHIVGVGPRCASGSLLSPLRLRLVGEAEAETNVGLEAEARAEERVAVVDEEEVRGGGSCAGVGFGEDTCDCVLRLNQGLSSGLESLRYRYV